MNDLIWLFLDNYICRRLEDACVSQLLHLVDLSGGMRCQCERNGVSDIGLCQKRLLCMCCRPATYVPCIVRTLVSPDANEPICLGSTKPEVILSILPLFSFKF